MQRSDESHFSLKTAFSAVLKTLRANRGLTQQLLAETSSRTYLSKLERGQSSLTLDKLNALSTTLELSPLTLVAVTLGAQRGESIKALIGQMEGEVRALAKAGVLKELEIPERDEPAAIAVPVAHKASPSSIASQQTAFHFADLPG